MRTVLFKLYNRILIINRAEMKIYGGETYIYHGRALDKIDMSKEKKEVRNHLKRCVIVNGLIKCKIKLLNLQYFDA